MKKRNGFTLIELLAVIVILSIIALISTPIIIGVIEKARKGAFEDSAYGLLDAGKTYFVDKLADTNQFEGAIFIFPNGGELKVSGSKPAGGSLVLDTDGKQALAIWDNDKKWCAYKTVNEEKITIKDYSEEDCQNPLVLAGAAKTIGDKNVPGNTEGLFTDDFGNIRYRGSNSVVKNYVSFNNEVWRIIGVFDGRVKLIRDERIPNPNDGSHPDGFLWNTANTNDWATSDLQVYLNNVYYNSLEVNAKKMIGENKYSLGGITDTQIDKKTIYELERGTTVYTGRPTEWTGKIGLMHLSDYGYAASEECTKPLYDYNSDPCRNNNWLYKSGYTQWIFTPYSGSSFRVAGVSYDGHAGGYIVDDSWVAVRPVIHINSSINVSSGDGTPSNPYQLSY